MQQTGNLLLIIFKLIITKFASIKMLLYFIQSLAARTLYFNAILKCFRNSSTLSALENNDLAIKYNQVG